jgi:hypothetical protein
MQFKGRLLIGMNGYEPDLHLIRYASMLVRLQASRRDKTGVCWPDAVSLIGTAPPCRPGPGARESELEAVDPEIRFVYLLPKQKSAKSIEEPRRGDLRAQVRAYFRATQRRWPSDMTCLKAARCSV